MRLSLGLQADGRRSEGALLCLAFLLCLGCAAQPPELGRRSSVAISAGSFIVDYSDTDSGTLGHLSQGIEAAAPAISRWGRLRSPVRIELMPTHERLERAVNRTGYDWLRAWARYDEVFLQSPRTWGSIGPSQSELNELLTHELTHCMMYQLSSDRLSWPEKEFPLWFREGMASYTANQGYRWPDLADLAGFFDGHQREDPVRHPESLYKSESDIVYSAAHHSFAFMVRAYGEAGVRQLLAAMREGPGFPEAFAKTTGATVDEFTAEFRRYVQSRRSQPSEARAESRP
jgi:hypothetical protein